jgi:peptide deformylase
MTIQTVLKMGNQQLATPSLPLENFAALGRAYPGLMDWLQDMRDTMEEKKGVGIAAPQIGYNKRVIMFGFEKNPRYPDAKPVPFTILINPVFKLLSHELNEAWEGCLSVPGLRGLVPRYNHIQYEGFDPDGRKITGIAQGFHARIIQHECDHLDGILFPQRVSDLKFFGFEDELHTS